MADNFAFPIPKEVLEPFIKEAVSVSIINALGDGAKLITYAIQDTLRTKVDAHGNISRYSSDNKYPLIDFLAQKELKVIVAEVVKEAVSALRTRVEEGVRRALSENAEDLGAAICDRYLDDIFKTLGVWPKKRPLPINNEEDD